MNQYNKLSVRLKIDGEKRTALFRIRRRRSGAMRKALGGLLNGVLRALGKQNGSRKPLAAQQKKAKKSTENLHTFAHKSGSFMTDH